MYLEYKHGKISSIVGKVQTYTIEELKNSNEEHSLHIILTQEQSVDAVIQDVSKILKETKDSNIKVEDVVLELDKGYLYTEDEVQHLKDLSTVCEAGNLHFDIKTDNYYENLNRFIIARKKVEDFAEKINNMKINGQNLSPAEKFMCCYAFAANRRYNMGDMSKKFMNDSKRNWIGVLSGDEVICSGFASTLQMLCDRVFSKEELRCYRQSLTVDVKETGEKGEHASNIVFINDPKYNIFNFFYCDSCWDCLRDNITPNFAHCLLPIQQIKNYGGNKVKLNFSHDDFFYHEQDGTYQKGPFYDKKGILTDLDKMFGKKTNKEIENEITENLEIEMRKWEEENKEASILESLEKSDELSKKREKEINEQIEQKHKEILEEGKDIIFAQQPPKELLQNGLFAVAKCFGLSDEQAQTFVQEKLENRQQSQQILFEESKVDEKHN